MPENKFHKINRTVFDSHLTLINEGRKPGIGSQFGSQEGQEGIDWGEMWSSMGADDFNRVLNTIGIPLGFVPYAGNIYDATTAGIFGARALGEKDPILRQKMGADAAWAGVASTPIVGEIAKWGRLAKAGLRVGAGAGGLAAHSALWPDEPDKTHQKTPGADQSITDTKNVSAMVDFLTKSNIPSGLGNYSRKAVLPGPLTWSGNQSLTASYERVATGIAQNLNEVRRPIRPGPVTSGSLTAIPRSTTPATSEVAAAVTQMTKPKDMPARTWARVKGLMGFLAAPAGIAALAAIAGPMALGALGKDDEEKALGDPGEKGAGGAQTAVERLASSVGYMPQFNPAAVGLQALARRAGGVMA